MGILSRPITWLALALLAAVVAVALLAQRAMLAPQAAGSGTSSASLAADIVIPAGSMTAPDFSLTDQDNKPVSVSALRGHVLAITFLDSHCKQLCPLQGDQLGQAMRLLAPRDSLSLLVVSVAPATDTADSERAFAAAHRWAADWHWLTGTPDELASVWKAYSIAVQGTPDNILHSTVLSLVDKRGFQRAGWASGLQPEQLARDIRFLQAEG